MDPIWPYAPQRCWTKGKPAGGSSSVAWDAAAMVGVHRAVHRGQVPVALPGMLWPLLCARALDRECNGQVRMPKGSEQETLTFCGCRRADKLTQGCWTKGEHAGGWSSIACDAAAMVGVRRGTIPREVPVGLLCAGALDQGAGLRGAMDRSGRRTIWGHSLSVELSKCPEGHWAWESQTQLKKKC